MGMFDKFNVDVNAYNEAIEENKAKQQERQNEEREYKDPVDGNYKCDLISMELGTNKAGDKLMLKGSFKIKDGEFAKQRLWINKVLTGTRNDGFAVKMAVDFLNSLGAQQQVEYTGDFDDLAKQIELVFCDVAMCEFVVEQKTSDSGFKNYYVKDVYDI